MHLTRNILDFYKNNSTNDWYLEKYFTNTTKLGLYRPYATNVVHSQPDGSSFIGTVDEYNTYEINSLGFRGKIDENIDILASGCSITFGLGIPELGRWTNILGNKLNKNILNMGNPGGSTKTICNNIIQYCMNNRMPEAVFCLMPDFFRNMVIVDKEFYKSKIKREHIENKDELQVIFCNPKIIHHKDNIFMEIKDNKYIEDYTSPHQLILDSINNIYNLESFCLSNNIKLYWTTWDSASALIMKELMNLKNFKLNNFSFLTQKNGNLINPEEVGMLCDSSHDSEFKDNICWQRGCDYSVVNYEKKTEWAHPGIHFQHHVAEFFYELYIAK